MTTTIEDIKPEIEAFEQMKDDLFKHHLGKHVIIKNKELVGVFDTFDAAAREAIRRFGREPFLIRQVAEQVTMPMPSSVAYRFDNAHP